MQQDIVHGFYLWPSEADGKASVFRFPVLPEQIIKIVPRTPSGSTITYRLLASGEPHTCDVVESVEDIKKLISHRRLLDKQASAVNSYGGVKGGKRIP